MINKLQRPKITLNLTTTTDLYSQFSNRFTASIMSRELIFHRITLQDNKFLLEGGRPVLPHTLHEPLIK